jgi:magnesium transporter
MLSISAHQGQAWIPDIAPRQLCEWVDQRDVLLWIDIEDPQEEDFALLQEQFEFHPLAIEDVRTSHQRPKIDLYDRYAFIVFYSARYDEQEHLVSTHEIELFVGQNYVVTLHDECIPELEETHTRWKENAAQISHDVSTLLYSILDTIMDGYFPVMDIVSERLDTLEARVFEEFDPEILRQVLDMKRNLLALRRVVGPQRDVLNVLLRGEVHVLPPEAMPYLQDLYDHALRVVENVDTYREMVMAVTEGFLTMQSNNMNEVMQRLTIINVLFLPLAVLTGFFGMNFEMLPFDNPLLLEVALIAMILFPAGLYLYLRWKGWG